MCYSINTTCCVIIFADCQWFSFAAGAAAKTWVGFTVVVHSFIFSDTCSFPHIDIICAGGNDWMCCITLLVVHIFSVQEDDSIR